MCATRVRYLVDRRAYRSGSDLFECSYVNVGQQLSKPVNHRRYCTLHDHVYRSDPSRMLVLLITIVCVLFVAMLFVNLYFRAKVLRAYRILVRSEVDFTPAQILSRQRTEEEVVPAYPAQAQAIRDFGGYLRRSIRMATVLLLLITLFGGILMWYRY